MAAFIAWYVVLTLLGWLTFPVAFRLLPILPDRGYTLARAAGLLLWAYAFWLFTTLGLSSNNLAGILFGLFPLIALSAWALIVRDTAQGGSAAGAAGPLRGAELAKWVRNNARLVMTTEVLFLAAFALLALLRAGNPTLDNAEKPMELMFINSILRSPGFPPHDGWLSGHAISYYYFGYVMTAMLARLAGITGSVAHNLMTALVFALSAIGSYGLLFNLLAVRGPEDAPAEERGPAASASLLAPFFLLVVSNVEGLLEVLHRRGILWTGARNFWTWLDIPELNQAPTSPGGWIPDRFWWWWRASRVISDYDLMGGAREVISEFPFFSFLHGDLHPHVLALPFLLLTLAAALNIFLGGWHRRWAVFGLNLRISPSGFIAAALLLGGLAFVNSWDILLGAALIVLAYGLMGVRLEGWSWGRVPEMLFLAAPLGLCAVLLYLPFYFGFSSQAGGLLPNLVSPTRGTQLWVMFAPLFIPLLAYLAYLALGERLRARWRLGTQLALGLVLFLLLMLLLIAWMASLREPALAAAFLEQQGAADFGGLVAAALWRRLMFIGGLISMLALLIPAIALLAGMPIRPNAASADSSPGFRHPKTYFTLLLIVIASLLVIGPEFLYLRDQFGYRLNTIFKFYFQAWLLWSIPAAMAVVVLLRRLRGAAAAIFTWVVFLLLVCSLTYPVLAVDNKTNGFKPFLGWTLDDFRRIERSNPDEASAILWLRSAPDGIVSEAVGGSYSEYGRISVYTGLPTVLGWPGHESQWRGSAAPQGTRQEDMKVLYETPHWQAAHLILQRYGIRYVFLGELERSTYHVQEGKFHDHLGLPFEAGSTRVYEVP